MTLLAVGSFIGIALASSNTETESYFYVAIFCSIFMGISQSIGECTVLGFLKGFPHDLVGDFSAGTGFAGPFATVSLLSMRASGMGDPTIFMI